MSEHGFTAISRDISAVLSALPPTSPLPLLVADLPVPTSRLARQVSEYAQKELPQETYNHSLRVYHFGLAIQKQHFPTWCLSPETYYVTSLLHDIGTTPANLERTKLSFEFAGGIVASKLLRSEGASQDLVEAVTEAIFRHQDVGGTGKITELGFLIQVATLLDNLGSNSNLVHRGTMDDVIAGFPRLKWSECFSGTIHREVALKPWAHSTALGEEFPEAVLGNKLMEGYE